MNTPDYHSAKKEMLNHHIYLYDKPNEVLISCDTEEKLKKILKKAISENDTETQMQCKDELDFIRIIKNNIVDQKKINDFLKLYPLEEK